MTILTISRDTPARFDPQKALGATIDAHGRGDTEEIFRPENVKAMRSAGFQPLSYRLATELCGEAWHWNPRGRWSDAAHMRGYWISSDEAPPDGEPITESFGYRLPRRGNTIDQAHDNDYSRIDDGDPSTFWKSNPYLDSPQWVIVDLGGRVPVDTITIRWAKPYASEYEVQWWSDPVADALNYPIGGDWIAFAHGTIRNGHGGTVTHSLGRATARWVRVMMTKPAGGPATADWRDAAGFAMAEIDIHGRGIGRMHHAKSHNGQTVVRVSSTDPWHRAEDIDRTLEQPGFDLVASSGLSRGLPMLMPVSLLYGTPEDAVAEIRYLRRRGIPVTSIELGEEPDGQYIAPEDYASLFMRWATALHAVDPSLLLGGPAFQSTRDFVAYWKNEYGETSWIGRFVAALRAANRLDDFGFFSFEWYPVDDVCGDAQKELVNAPRLYANVVARWRREGLPESVPLLVTEYGWSSFAAKEEIGIVGALFDVDFIADFLASGGSAAYFYTLEPAPLIREQQECTTYGNLVLFLSDDEHRITRRVPAYWAMRLLLHEWLAPSGEHEIAPADGDALLRAWSVRRPDGSRSMLIINKDDRAPRTVRIDGATAMWQFGEGDKEPRFVKVSGEVEVPPHSMSVVMIRVTAASESSPTRATPAPAARAQRLR